MHQQVITVLYIFIYRGGMFGVDPVPPQHNMDGGSIYVYDGASDSSSEFARSPRRETYSTSFLGFFGAASVAAVAVRTVGLHAARGAPVSGAQRFQVLLDAREPSW